MYYLTRVPTVSKSGAGKISCGFLVIVDFIKLVWMFVHPSVGFSVIYAEMMWIKLIWMSFFVTIISSDCFETWHVDSIHWAIQDCYKVLNVAVKPSIQNQSRSNRSLLWNNAHRIIRWSHNCDPLCYRVNCIVMRIYYWVKMSSMHFLCFVSFPKTLYTANKAKCEILQARKKPRDKKEW